MKQLKKAEEDTWQQFMCHTQTSFVKRQIDPVFTEEDPLLSISSIQLSKRNREKFQEPAWGKLNRSNFISSSNVKFL